jgi:YVTN family beta-propeller protein
MRRAARIFLALAIVSVGLDPALAEAPSFAIDGHIPLGAIKGRIDHLAADVEGHRLFVAELGNDSVAVIDLTTGRQLARIDGLAEPQGIGWEPGTRTLWVANARDGTVRIFQDATWKQADRIDLGDDADNIRIADGRVYVGYGSGSIAVIDPATRKVLSSTPLKGHPEGFQVDPVARKAYVNVPDRGEIAAVDLATGAQVSSWPLRGARANFPISLAPNGVIVAARQPAVLLRYGFDGVLRWAMPTCGDADDVFYDTRRMRIDVACGEGFVESRADAAEGQAQRIRTAPRARTALFVPELDRIFVAIPSTPSHSSAEVLVLRPLE